MNLVELFRYETDVVAIPAGQVLFRAGERANLMYVLMKGTAAVTVGNVLVDTVEPGALLGELALIEHVPRSATVTAVTDCQFLPIDEKHFRFLVEQTPNFALHVMKVMGDRLRRVDLLLLQENSKFHKPDQPVEPD